MVRVLLYTINIGKIYIGPSNTKSSAIHKFYHRYEGEILELWKKTKLEKVLNYILFAHLKSTPFRMSIGLKTQSQPPEDPFATLLTLEDTLYTTAYANGL